MQTGIKKRLECLEAQVRAKAPDIRIVWVDEDGRIVGYTLIVPVKFRNAHKVPYVDYRQIFKGAPYADYERRLEVLEAYRGRADTIAYVVLYPHAACVRRWSGHTEWVLPADACRYLNDPAIKVYQATADFDPEAA